jgi:glycosyltransferase involved in cell wall biosynthesis
MPELAAAPVPSSTHLVLIPSYNSGRLVVETVLAARAVWNPVWVVFDGSDDGSDVLLEQALGQAAQRTQDQTGVRIIKLPANQGKGTAILTGLKAAQANGFTHALTMDADGQHPADFISRFMSLSREQPDAMILGRPVFDANAPSLRVKGRRISNWWTNLETLWSGVDDSLFGFRVYPVAALTRIMSLQPWMRRFDFDVEAAVRLCWSGVRPISIDAPVRYLSLDEGGVSHFRYGRDNVLLTWMHSRLLLGFLIRLPLLLIRKLRGWPAR